MVRFGSAGSHPTALTIPTTFSISHGIGYGVIASVLLKLLTGRFGEISPLLAAVAAAFAAYFVWAA